MFKCFKRKDRGPSTTPDQIEEVVNRPPLKIKRIALIAGHTDKKFGTVSYNGLKEFFWNQKVIDQIANRWDFNGKVILLYRRQYGSYSRAMKELAKQCERDKIDLAIEFHLNAAGIPEARGFEFLIKHGADDTAKIASHIADVFRHRFEIVPRGTYKGLRGVKGLKSNDRGSSFCLEMEKRGIKAFLFEPFFCDYKTSESEIFLEQKDFGVQNMADFWIQTIKGL